MASFGKASDSRSGIGFRKSGLLGGTFGDVRSRDGDGKLFSLDRTLSGSSSDVRFPDPSVRANGDREMGIFELNSSSMRTNCDDGGDEGVCPDPSSNETCHPDHFHYLDEDDFSLGLPSDLPSGLVDIEGNIIDGDVNVRLRFGQDVDENDLNEDEDELSSLPDDPQMYNKQITSSKYNTSSHGRRSQSSKPFFKMVAGKKESKSKALQDFRNPHQFNDFIQLRSHRGKPTRANSSNNNNGNGGFGNRKSGSVSASSCSNSTITQHYYPEGGWGYVVLIMAFLSHTLMCGIHLSSGIVIWGILKGFGGGDKKITAQDAGWLAALSFGISLFLSPIWVSICKRKSTRLTAVFGGLVASMGCLFTSFASQFHQLFLSYVAFVGIGIGLTRDASSLMVGQYFKRKRDLVEVILVSASGLGILLMSASIRAAISSLGWRLGLQAITGSLCLTFFLSTCYRSASLYHPQRRAILHLKNQKRKVKEKEKLDDEPPFLDFSCLRSKTLRILLLSSAFTAFGINTPLFYLAIERDNEGRLAAEVDGDLGAVVPGTTQYQPFIPVEFSLVILQAGIGVSWIAGSFLFGLIVFQKNQECRVSKQYLCQIAGVISGISILALATTEGFNGLVIFSCAYGFSLGGYNYALKVYTYERVRARHFPRAWSFIQSSQAIPLVLGVPLTGYLNTQVGWKSGYYLSALSVIIGSAFLFLTDVRKRKLSRRKINSSSVKTRDTSDSAQTPKIGRLSFSFPEDQLSPQSLKHESKPGVGGLHEEPGLDPELLAHEMTCVSDDGIPGLHFKDVYFEEWADYLGGDCITSCNKVENCLVSEMDAEHPLMLDRRSRRWSAAKSNLILQAGGIGAAAAAVAGGIVGIGNISQNLPPSSSARVSPDEFNIVGSPAGSTSEGRVFMSVPKEIPAYRNPSPKPDCSQIPEESKSVIHEARV